MQIAIHGKSDGKGADRREANRKMGECGASKGNLRRGACKIGDLTWCFPGIDWVRGGGIAGGKKISLSPIYAKVGG